MSYGVSAKILPYITELTDYKFGLRKESATITRVSTNAEIHYEQGINCFLFSLPNRKNMIQWQFIFDLENLMLPPDIVSDDNFYAHFDPNYVKKIVPSLENWDPTNAKCVLQLVLELLQLHQKYQLCKLFQHDALNGFRIHYERLKKEISTDNIEVEVSIIHPRAASVQFCVGLKFDVDDLPISQSAGQSHIVWLSIQYNSLVALPNITIKLHDELAQLIETPQLCNDDMQIPFEDIVEDFAINIGNQINKFRGKLQRRRELFTIFRSIDSLQILEVDDELFTKFSFHFKQDKKHVVCLIEITIDLIEGHMILIKGQPQTILNFSLYENDSQEIAKAIINEFHGHLLKPSEMAS